MSNEQTQGFDFPCAYQIKAMGIDDGDFHELVIAIVSRHSDAVDRDSVQARPSRTGRYVSVSVTIEARSHAQLDAIYADLTAHEKVLMRL